MAAPGLAQEFSVARRYESFYTGGHVSATPDGSVLACMRGANVAFLHVASGTLRLLYDESTAELEEAVSAFQHAANGQHIFVGTARGTVRVCRLPALGDFLREPAAEAPASKGAASDARGCQVVRSWRAHMVPVLHLEQDPSGSLLATGSSDRTVKVWDIAGGFGTHVFKGHRGIVTALAWHPDPNQLLLVSGDDSGNVRVWDLHTSKCVASLSEHAGAVTGFAWSSDGWVLATVGRDQLIHLWCARDWSLLATKPAFEAMHSAAALTPFPRAVLRPDGTAHEPTRQERHAPSIFATGGDGGSVRIWGLEVGPAPSPAAAPKVTLTALGLLQLQAAGTSAAAGDGESAALSAAIESLVPLRMPATLQLSAGKPALPNTAAQLVVVTRDQAFQVTDVCLAAEAGSSLPSVQLRRKGLLLGHLDQVLDVAPVPALAPEHASAVSTAAPRSQHGTPESHGHASYEELQVLVRAAQAGTLVAMASNSEAVRLLDTRSFRAGSLLGHAAIVLCVRVSPCGRYIASASKDRTVRVWDVLSGACVAIAEGHTEAVGALAWPARRGPWLARQVPWLLSASSDLTLKAWDMMPVLDSSPAKAGRKRQRSAAASGTQQLLTRSAVKAHAKDINSIAVAPNDAMAATGSQDKTIKVWTVPDLQLVHTLTGHKRPVWAVAFSPREKLLASASADKTVRLWSIADGSTLRTLEGHNASALSVTWFPSGAQLATSSADGTVKVWTARTGECNTTLDGHESRVWCVAAMPTAAAPAAADTGDAGSEADMSSDGSSSGGSDSDIASEPVGSVQLVTGGADSTLCVWRDVTSELEAAELAMSEEMALKTQALYNAMAARAYGPAVRLCLECGHSARLRDILTELLEVGPLPTAAAAQGATPAPAGVDAALADPAFGPLPSSWHARMAVEAAALHDLHYVRGDEDVEHAQLQQSLAHGPSAGAQELRGVLAQLRSKDVDQLLTWLRVWGTQARHANMAFGVLAALLLALSASSLRACRELPHTITALLPYAKRHLSRWGRLLTSTWLLDLAIGDSAMAADADASTAHLLGLLPGDRAALTGAGAAIAPALGMEGMSSCAGIDAAARQARPGSAAPSVPTVQQPAVAQPVVAGAALTPSADEAAPEHDGTPPPLSDHESKPADAADHEEQPVLASPEQPKQPPAPSPPATRSRRRRKSKAPDSPPAPAATDSSAQPPAPSPPVTRSKRRTRRSKQ